ncbi:adenylyl cyclase-associated protein 2, partial [Lates japonicus]
MHHPRGQHPSSRLPASQYKPNHIKDEISDPPGTQAESGRPDQNCDSKLHRATQSPGHPSIGSGPGALTQTLMTWRTTYVKTPHPGGGAEVPEPAPEFPVSAPRHHRDPGQQAQDPPAMGAQPHAYYSRVVECISTYCNPRLHGVILDDRDVVRRRPPARLESLKDKKLQSLHTREEIEEKIKLAEERRKLREDELKMRLRAQSARVRVRTSVSATVEDEDTLVTPVKLTQSPVPSARGAAEGGESAREVGGDNGGSLSRRPGLTESRSQSLQGSQVHHVLDGTSRESPGTVLPAGGQGQEEQELGEEGGWGDRAATERSHEPVQDAGQTQQNIPSEIYHLDQRREAELVNNALQTQRTFLKMAATHQEPAETELQDLLKPISDHIQEIQNFRERNRGSSLFNHLSAVSESIPALGWIAVSQKPGPYVKEMNDAATFYTNRVLKDYKEIDRRHVDWVRSYLSIWTEMQSFIKQHHTTGLMWSKS